MTISMYAASVPVFMQLLGGLNDVLAKANAHAIERKIEAGALLHARLFPDMFTLQKQVEVAVDFAQGIGARLAGAEVPTSMETGAGFEGLQARIAAALSFLSALDAQAFAASEQREIVLRPGTPKERKLNGQSYLLNYGLPQFFFHVTTAYAILRHSGVAIGKRDYMGAY